MAALAMATAVTGVAGCSSKAANAAAADASESPGPPLSTADAAAAFRTFTAADSVARASGDERLALSLAVDGRAQLTAAAYRTAAYSGVPVPRYRYGKPDLFVPTIAGYPRWFVAMADRWQGGTRRTALMVFNKPDKDARWQLSLSTLLNPGEPKPQPARDARGFAEALPTKTTGLVSEPRMVGALQATMVEEGTSGPAAGIIAPGPYTSGLHQTIVDTKKRMGARKLIYDAVFTATSTPMFVLRTRDGGALVLYCYALETTTKPVKRLKRGQHIPIPDAAAPLLKKLVVKKKLETTQTYQYAAYLPKPRGADPRHPLDEIRVIGADGGISDADGDTDDKS